MAQFVKSTWAHEPISVGGDLASPEWDGAAQFTVPSGFIRVKNDAEFLYLALDLVGDTSNDPGTQDYFLLTFDINRNWAITANVDTLYGLRPGHTNELARCMVLGPGTSTGILTEDSTRQCNIGFGASSNGSTPHRIWEMRIPLAELNVSLNWWSFPFVRFGIKYKTGAGQVHDFPANALYDYSNLNLILLSRKPNLPVGEQGPVIGGVGIIPSTRIDSNGYATTDSSYSLPVTEAVFGSSLNLVGNRTTLTNLWYTKNARRYRVLHRAGNSGDWGRLRAAWSNYHWVTDDYVLESFGPDDNDTYPMINPNQDYSIDDLLIRWNSKEGAPGLHQFKVEFLDAGGGPVTGVPEDILGVQVDNNLPMVELQDLIHDDDDVAACEIVKISGADDGLQCRILVKDGESHLQQWQVHARWGNGSWALLGEDSYQNHPAPDHKWMGVEGHIVPATPWMPLATCAHEFRVRACSRVTNGYGMLDTWVYSSRFVTVEKPGAPIYPSKAPKLLGM